MSPFAVPLVYVDFTPTAEETTIVATFASTRGIRLRAPTPYRPRVLPWAPEVARAIEDDLALAREALLALDLARAGEVQARNRDRLLAHPELPVAPFLRAEWFRVEAMRKRRLANPDEAGAKADAARAEALDGGRALAIGEEPPEPNAPVPQTFVGVPASLRRGASDGTSAHLWIDGKPWVFEGTAPGTTALALALAPGPHHIRATAEDGATIMATWFDAGATPETTTHAVSFPIAPPCSDRDLERGARASGSTTCSDFFEVRRGKPHGSGAPELELARCNQHGCGHGQTLVRPSPQKAHSSPAFLPWLFVGATGAAVVAVALTAAGAFSSGAQPLPVFRNGGVKTE